MNRRRCLSLIWREDTRAFKERSRIKWKFINLFFILFLKKENSHFLLLSPGRSPFQDLLNFQEYLIKIF